MSALTMINRPATMSVESAAALLGISRATAYRLARNGELPGAIRLGHRIVVSRTALERLLAGDEGGTAP
jgi:excisionase family DNA binding protein